MDKEHEYWTRFDDQDQREWSMAGKVNESTPNSSKVGQNTVKSGKPGTVSGGQPKGAR